MRQTTMNKAIGTLFLLLTLGCADQQTALPIANTTPILLPVPSLYSTYAAIDGWNDTPVALAYRTAPALVYDNNFVTVVVQTSANQTIHTGLGYPTNNDLVTLRGYHPVQTPTNGKVIYDLSKADLDLMVSNEVFGNRTNTILTNNTKLQFAHKLTRLTFSLQCKPDVIYPERIAGIQIKGAKSFGTLDLLNGSVAFTGTNNLFIGRGEGYEVPISTATPLILEALIEPNVPLVLTLITLSGIEKEITFKEDLAMLTSAGGAAGSRYKINLTFDVKDVTFLATVINWTEAQIPIVLE